MNEAEQYLRHLRQTIARHFNLEELKTVAFDMGLKWDEIAGDALTPKIRNLLLYTVRHNCLVDLLAVLRRERPSVQWSDPPHSLTIPRKAPTTKEGRVRQALLERVRAFWVEGVLEKSLYGVARLELGLEYDPEAVDRPWMMTLERPHTPEEEIAPGTRMITLFEELNRSLLILGEPGSGKTTMLLELARDLLDRTELDDSEPIPLVFNLSSWGQKRGSLLDWLVEELNQTYRVNEKFGKKWLEDESARLLLDGLDEVAADHRDACIIAINEFRRENSITDMVICSRTVDYEELTGRLQLPGAVHIKPLNSKQVDEYLAIAGEKLAGVRAAVQIDTELQDLAKSPLMLSIMTLAYQGYTHDQLNIDDQKQRHHHLFATYIQRMFERRPTVTEYSTDQALHWLTYLAHQMSRMSITNLHVDTLRQNWLPIAIQRNAYTRGIRFSLGLIIGMLGLLIGKIVMDWDAGLIIGLVAGIVSGSIGTLNGARLWWGYNGSVWIGFRWIKPHGLMDKLIEKFFAKVLKSNTYDYPFTYMLIGNTLNGGMSSAIFFGLVFLGFRPESSMLDAFVIAICSGVLIGLYSGGEEAIRRVFLRYCLHRYNHVPWHAVAFLNDMAKHLLLRKVGDSYIFAHRLLLEYFARLYEDA